MVAFYLGWGSNVEMIYDFFPSLLEMVGTARVGAYRMREPLRANQ